MSVTKSAPSRLQSQTKWFYDSDGMLVIEARVPAKAKQMLIKAFEAACEAIPAAEKLPADVSAKTP